MAGEEQGTPASDGGDSIKIFVRARPILSGEVDLCVQINTDSNAIIMQSKPEPKVFKFDQVADVCTTQETVFSSVGKRLIESCVQGYNGTIFAYGQTGSGKTFTMLGPAEGTDNFQHKLRGIIPRSFDYLFTLMKREVELQGEKVQFLCKCSFLEIYNEQIFDLLDPASAGLHLRENIKRGVFVDGLTEHAVTNASEAYDVLSCGWMHRTVASTSMNRESSRSHAVFTVSIESKTMNNGVWNVRSSVLNLVDLAGSERQKDTHTVGVRLKEAGSINRSLSALGNVIMALGDVAHGKTRHVPYRDSKLSFLLRDSLGGNAKTFIIACVHPGGKCFGETLSTLQFARRAKMIKTKAVLNEDAFGSVTHMQAEIKRLKDVIVQLQQGQLLTCNSTEEGQEDSGAGTCTGAGDAGQATKWRQSFLQAMFLREKVLQEKKTQHEKFQNLQETCSRKDQALRQNRMVLKFREEALKKLDKAQKEKRVLEPDEKDDLIEVMQKEIGTLMEINNQHPDVTRLRMENDSLRDEVKRLRAQNSVASIDREKAKELDRHFRDLMAEHEGQIPCYSTPSQSQDSTVAVATLDRQKSQIEKLQEELDTVRKELSEDKERAQKALMEKEAELAAVSKGREEMEKALKAHRVKSQIERETREDMHNETIKTMTTPKKAGYQLRNRTVAAPGSGLAMYDLDESLTEPDNITSEQEPAQLVEERTEALMEQIKKLQESNRCLTTQHENREADIIKQVEEVSRLESRKAQLTELYEKDKVEWSSQLKSLQEQVDVLTKKEREMTFENQMLLSEVQDLRIVSTSQDKRMTEVQAKERHVREEKERQTAALETQLLKLESELEKWKKEMSQSLEDQDKLKESEENLQATLAFSEDRLAGLEAQLADEREKSQDLETAQKALLGKLEQSELKNDQLTCQLEEHGDKEQQLLKSLHEVDRQRHELGVKDREVGTLNAAQQKLQSEYEALRTERDTLLKKEHDNKDVMNSLTERLEDQRQALSESKHRAENYSTELEDSRQQVASQVVELENVTLTLEQERRRFQEQLDAMNIEMDKKAVEAEMAREDFDAQQQEMEAANTEIAKLVAEKAVLESNIKDLGTQAVELKERLAEQGHMLEGARQEHDKTSEQKDSELATSRAEQLETALKLQRTEQKLRDMQDAFDVISDQHHDYISKYAELESEVKAEREQAVILEQDATEWRNKYNSLHVVTEVEEDCWKERETSLKEDLCVLQARTDEADAVAAAAEKSLAYVVNEKEELQDCLDALQVDQIEIDSEQKRLRELIETKNEENSALDSRLKEMEENLLHITKEREQWEIKYNAMHDENVKLAGHQNPAQKIHYTQTLKEQNNKLREMDFSHPRPSAELKQANRELSKLRHRMPVQSKVMSAISTPERQPSLERRGTPGPRQGDGTPSRLAAANHTPGRLDIHVPIAKHPHANTHTPRQDKRCSSNDRNTPHKENVKPNLTE